MMKSRGAAVIGAFVLIALAIFVRGLLVDGGNGSGSDGPGEKGDGGKPVIACTPELMDVCDALAKSGSIAKDPPELDLPDAADPPPEVDGWITWNPAPQIANSAVQPDNVWQEPVVLGSAAGAVLIDRLSLTALPSACRSKPTWTCLGQAAPELSIGVGDPVTSEGIARLAPFARTFTTEDDFQELDFEALDDLIASPLEGQSDASDMADRIVTARGSLSMTSGPNDLLAAQAGTQQGKQYELSVLTPSPRTRLVVVLAGRVGRNGSVDDLACGSDPPDALADPLTALGITPCTGSADDALAGFLFQVRKKVG